MKIFRLFLPLLILSQLSLADGDTELKTLTSDVLNYGTFAFQEELRSNKIKKRLVKCMLYGAAAAAVAYTGYKWSTDTVDIIVRTTDGKLLAAQVTGAGAKAIPDGTAIVAANIPVGAIKAFPSTVFGKMKHYAGSTWGLATGAGWWLGKSYFHAAVGDVVKMTAHSSIFRCYGLFDERDVKWCLQHSNALLQGYNVKLHAAVLDCDSCILKYAHKDKKESNDLKVDITVYPDGDTSYQINEHDIEGGALKEMIGIQRYVEIRKSFVKSDVAEQQKEIELLGLYWNNFIDGLAFACGRIQYDIDTIKRKNALLAMPIVSFRDALVKTINETVPSVEEIISGNDYANLYGTIQNCMIQCEHIMHFIEQEIEKALALSQADSHDFNSHKKDYSAYTAYAAIQGN